MITIGHCSFYEISKEFVCFNQIAIEQTEISQGIMKKISNQDKDTIKNVQIELSIPEKFKILPYDEIKDFYSRFLLIKGKWEEL